ncbi:hypothetical protein SLEP1_g42453 [Rubroshorea leprosula]|uniref:Uncharacterized protein n=1 Tax=Rubroshorea leprosula TaxID=152421 RepID=A0AAV5L9U5_9ROSI|nr:hypothetical protein SLEP1_g42453 [Rubroshorea leprosula]
MSSSAAGKFWFPIVLSISTEIEFSNFMRFEWDYTLVNRVPVNGRFITLAVTYRGDVYFVPVLGRWANPLLCKRFKAILANVECFLDAF